ncbi:hypothetical protein GGD38_004044 [Chitinophagaceae bacterium OAS944]|nr:hypothetical protein [Chitinophagaceae bacterium OAS944]
MVCCLWFIKFRKADRNAAFRKARQQQQTIDHKPQIF